MSRYLIVDIFGGVGCAEGAGGGGWETVEGWWRLIGRVGNFGQWDELR